MRSLVFILPLLFFACGSHKSDPQPDNSGGQLKPDTPNTPPENSPPPNNGENKVVCVNYSKSKQYCADLEWISGPKFDDYSEAKLTLKTTELKAPQKAEAVKVTPWMKIHGHGTGDVQPEVKVVDGTTNVFRVTNIYFIMSGPWELLIDATVDGRKDSLEFSVQVPK